MSTLKLCTPRSSHGNRSNEIRNSPVSEDVSLKNIELNFNEQKFIIMQMQERIDQGDENRQMLGDLRLLIFRIKNP